MFKQIEAAPGLSTAADADSPILVPGGWNAPTENPSRAGGSARPKQAAREIARERRAAPRQPFPYLQRIAPVRHGYLPDLDEFYWVKFHEMSIHGASFYVLRAGFEMLVVECGVRENSNYLLSRVVRSRPVESDGEPVSLVSCVFVDRVRPRSGRPDAEIFRENFRPPFSSVQANL